MIDPQEREARIQRLVDRSNLTRELAAEAVAMSLGESDGDIETVPQVTIEERRRRGIGLTMDEALARMEQRARELAKTGVGS